MALQAVCERCQNDVNETELVYIEVWNRSVCHMCVNNTLERLAKCRLLEIIWENEAKALDKR